MSENMYVVKGLADELDFVVLEDKDSETFVLASIAGKVLFFSNEAAAIRYRDEINGDKFTDEKIAAGENYADELNGPERMTGGHFSQLMHSTVTIS